MATKVEPTYQNKVFFFGLFLGISILTFIVIRPFLSLVIIAFLIATLFRPLYLKLVRAFKGKEQAPVLLTLLAIILSFVVPVTFIGVLTYNQVREFNEDISGFVSDNVSDADDAIDKANEFIDRLPFADDYELTQEDIESTAFDLLDPIGDFILDKALGWTSSALSIVTSLIVFLVLLTTFLRAQPKLIGFFRRISPLDDEIDMIFINRVIAMSTSMIKGTFVVAIVQGVVSGLLLLILGVDYAFFWGLLSTFVSIIPLGSGVVNVPIGITLIATGDVVGGVIIILFNLLITGNIDNYLRPKLVAKEAKLPSALILLGVLGGIEAFGFFGFIYGPVIMILFITLIETYMKYYRKA